MNPFVTSLRRLSQSGLKVLFFYAWTVRRLCVTGTNLGKRKQNEIRACAIYAMLDWRWFGVLLASTFTRGETLTFLRMQKMCGEVDAHSK